MSLPVLYSFRRCPYAIRARLALAGAGLEPGRDLELREVSLTTKPPELLEASAKGTVPVLVVPAGPAQGAMVLEESLTIMRWALARRDPHGWLAGEGDRSEDLIAANDGPFKHHLDRFKYAARHGVEGERRAEEHRRAALAILSRWNRALLEGGWLLGSRPTLADWALLPFVRQFRLADPEAFAAEPGLAALQGWLARFLEGPELAAVMAPPWSARRPWRSERWLYHLALEPEWRQALQAGVAYTRSTRGRALQEVGYIHASYAHQVAATARRFYGDAGAVVLLTLDPHRLEQAGVPVRAEPAPESDERFPHLYGPLPLEAVLRVDSWRPEPAQP